MGGCVRGREGWRWAARLWLRRRGGGHGVLVTEGSSSGETRLSPRLGAFHRRGVLSSWVWQWWWARGGRRQDRPWLVTSAGRTAPGGAGDVASVTRRSTDARLLPSDTILCNRALPSLSRWFFTLFSPQTGKAYGGRDVLLNPGLTQAAPSCLEDLGRPSALSRGSSYF